MAHVRVSRLEFPLAKAEYLLSYSTRRGEGGDKRKFWHEVMGFDRPETLRGTLLARVSIEALNLQRRDVYGERYMAVVPLRGPSGVSRQIRTLWSVRTGEDVARFVTAFPEKGRA